MQMSIFWVAVIFGVGGALLVFFGIVRACRLRAKYRRLQRQHAGLLAEGSPMAARVIAARCGMTNREMADQATPMLIAGGSCLLISMGVFFILWGIAS